MAALISVRQRVQRWWSFDGSSWPFGALVVSVEGASVHHRLLGFGGGWWLWALGRRWVAEAVVRGDMGAWLVLIYYGF